MERPQVCITREEALLSARSRYREPPRREVWTLLKVFCIKTFDGWFKELNNPVEWDLDRDGEPTKSFSIWADEMNLYGQDFDCSDVELGLNAVSIEYGYPFRFHHHTTYDGQEIFHVGFVNEKIGSKNEKDR